MAFGRERSTFRLFFPLYQLYWSFCQQLENGLINQHMFSVLSWKVYEKLKQEWLKFKWDLDELDWIAFALDYKYSMLDPINFVNTPIAYVDHAKTCFFPEHNNFSFSMTLTGAEPVNF